MQAEYSLPWVNGLRANVTFGFDVTNGYRTNFTPSTLHREVVTGRGGFQTRYNPKQVNLVLETYLNYTTPKPVGPGILDLIGGYSYTETHFDSLYYEGNSLSTDAFGNDSLVPAATTKNIMFESRSKLISFFGRVNYNINDKYILAASVRRDGSSRFGEDNTWGTFPSVSVGWRLSQESFLSGIEALSDLKLRGSWAKTGNQSFGNYLQYSSYRWAMSRPSTRSATPLHHHPAQRGGPQHQVGGDPGLERRPRFRVRQSADHRGHRLLRQGDRRPALQRAGGGVHQPVELRHHQHRQHAEQGIEMSLGARVLQGGERGLTWQADFTAAHNTNELLSITPFGGSSLKILTGEVSGGVGTRIQVFAPGEPINSFYVYEHIREGGQPIYRDVNGDRVDGLANGTINEQDLYVDQNGDGIINQGDLRPFHDPAPNWILGHSSYLALGNFDLGFTLRAYLGNYVYNNVASANGDFRELTQGSPYNLHTSVLETEFATQQLQSDFYVEDASFLRMDNITLGYTFNLGGQPARVFGTVQNVFTVTGYSGVDPSGNITPVNPSITSSLNGIDNNIYPRSRTFSAGLSLRL